MTITDQTQVEAYKKKLDYLESLEEQGALSDYCIEYELEDEIQENIFNMDFNQPDLKWIFEDEKGKETPPVTDQFLSSIVRRIKNQSHILIFIFGKTNSGKSEVAQTLSKYYEAQFKRLFNKEITIHLAFDDFEVRNIFSLLKIGDLIFRDESPQATERGSRNVEVHIDNVLRSFRKHQHSCIFVDPDPIKHPRIDYFIYVLGKNKEKRETRCMLYEQHTEPRTLEKVIVPIGRIYLPLHDDKEFRKIYEQRKDDFIKSLKTREGVTKETPEVLKIKKDARILVDLCKKYGRYSKKTMELLLLNYNYQLDPHTEGDKKIGGNDHYNELLFEQTKLYLENPDQMRIDAGKKDKKEHIDTKEEDPLLAQLEDYLFPYSNKDILDFAKKTNRFWDAERDFEIYEKIINSQGRIQYNDLIDYYSNLNDESSVRSIIKKIQNLQNTIKGDLHEEEYTKHLKSIFETNPNNKVIHKGGSGDENPDIYVILDETNELYIFSCKNLKIDEHLGYYPIDEIEPELRFAREHRFEYKHIRVFVALVNNNHANSFHLYEIKDFTRIKPLKLT